MMAEARDIAAAIAAQTKALVKASPMTQIEVAAAAYPGMVPASALRRLQRLMTGSLELRPRDAAALSRALSRPWRDLYSG